MIFLTKLSFVCPHPRVEKTDGTKDGTADFDKAITLCGKLHAFYNKSDSNEIDKITSR